METRVLGNSGLALSVIGLGTWAIGGGGWAYGWGKQDDRDSINAIHRSLDLGINWVDTAPVYGLGHSEEIVGKALQGRKNIIIATKCGLAWNHSGEIFGRLTKKSLQKELHESLKRLKWDVIDIYQIHWPNPNCDIEEAWETLSGFVQEGKVRYIGVSNFSVPQMEMLKDSYPITSLQPPYNMIRAEIERDILPFCQKNNIGVVTYSPMQCGLLTGKMTRKRISDLPEDDWRKSKNPSFQEPELTANLELVDQLRPIAEANNMTLAQLAIAWVLRKTEATSAIVGIRSTKQIEDILSGIEWKLPPAAADEIDNLIDQRIDSLRERKKSTSNG